MATLCGIGVVVAYTLTLGYFVQRSGLRYGEANYFLERMRDVADAHARIYRDIEFPYGPLLLLPPVWLHRSVRSISLGQAYFVCLAAMNAVGLAWVAWLANRLPLTRNWRVLLFALCAFVQLHPLAGPNYSLFKFAAPPFLFLWSTRRRRGTSRALAFFASNLAVLLISPELAIGTAAATIVYSALMLMRRNWLAAGILLAPPAALVSFVMLFGRGFIDRLAHASGGALNLIPEPLPHLAILGIAVAWLVPQYIGTRLRGKSPDAPQMAGLFVLAMGLLPGALGRCDPLHVFFNGLTFFMLSAAAVQGVRHRKLWAGALVLLALNVQAVNYTLYRGSLLLLLHPPAQASVPVDALQAAIGGMGGRIATPVLSAVPLQVELDMRRAGLFVTDFYPGLDEIWDEAGERRKLASMDRETWILAPKDIGTLPEPLPNTEIKRIFRMNYRYRQQRASYPLGRLLNNDLQTNWTRVRRFGDLFLYRHTPQVN